MDTTLLLKELQALHDFPEKHFPQLLGLFEVHKIKKGEIIFQSGDIVKHIHFVIEGCLRQYYVNPHGAERILFFAEEGWWAGEMESFINNIPTTLNMQALEDCQTLMINRENWEHATRNIPDYALYQIKKRGQTVAWFKGQLAESTTSTPDEKYRKLVNENATLLQRLPQYYIANFLGVTPETLSRIRKRNTKL